MCHNESDSTTVWETTLSGETAFGECVPGFVGSPQRVCTLSGQFGPISGTPCTRMLSARKETPGGRHSAHKLCTTMGWRGDPTQAARALHCRPRAYPTRRRRLAPRARVRAHRATRRGTTSRRPARARTTSTGPTSPAPANVRRRLKTRARPRNATLMVDNALRHTPPPSAVLYCEEDTDSSAFATFPTSPANGQPQTGECLPGYGPLATLPKRTCQTTGVWSETTGGCQRTYCTNDVN